MIRYCLPLVLLFFWNCTPDTKTNDGFINETSPSFMDSVPTKQNYDSLVVKNKDILPFSPTVKKITALAEKKEGEKFSLYFDVTTQTKAFVKIITEDDLANIRLNQIITPDQESDGPFGKEAEFPLYQGGTYQLVFAESLMQGNPFQGKFKVEIELK